MKNCCVKIALVLVVICFWSASSARDVPAVMQPNGKLAPNGPSVPVGGIDETTGMRTTASTINVGGDNMWLVSLSGGAVICDAGGECADVTVLGASFSAALFGLNIASANYVWDGANWIRRTGTAGSADATITGPLGSAAAAASVSTAPATDAYYMVSKTAAANAVTNPLWMQISQDGVTAVGAANPIPISDDMAANAVGNTIHVELSDGAAAFLDNTASPGYFRQQDGDSTVVADVIDTQADGLALTLNSSVQVPYLYNGATLDMARNTASKGLQVGVESWPIAYDEGNAWVGTYKKSIKILNTPKESTTTTVSTATTVLSSTEVGGYPNFTVYLKNADASAHLTDADIQVSPDATTWISLEWTDCDTLNDGVGCVYSLSNQSHRYVRVQATDDGNAADMEAWLTANLN